MAKELAYALITPYSLMKSRTGGIIGRMLALPTLRLVGAHMYAPSDAFVDEYVRSVEEQEIEPKIKGVLVKYINEHLRPSSVLGITNRMMLLLFEGTDALRSLKDSVIGSLASRTGPTGDTVRGTFGDMVELETGEIIYFEPAVLTTTNSETLYKQLALFERYAARDGGALERVIRYPEGVKPETTLVIIKPDNFVRSSSRPGNIIDRFSRTGLYIVGAKVLKMSVAQARRFYEPLRQQFVERLRKNVMAHLRGALEGAFDFPVDEETFEKIADELKDANAECEFLKIVSYMTGVAPSECRAGEGSAPGKATSLALLYQGENAIDKIRRILGSTNPDEAAEGTVRSDFGRNLMQNGAHASDTVESALRERRIVGLAGDEKEWEIQGIIRKYLSQAQR
ncbi:MAG: nucleoside-diphosphate kinase [Planctomycetota bacterium]